MRIKDIINENKKVEFQGLTLNVSIDGQNVDIRAIVNDKQVGYVVFDRDGDRLIALDLSVNSEFQRQKIATKMYDYVKSLGFIIYRSPNQLSRGKLFWDKSRGEKGKVWESKIISEIERIRQNVYSPDLSDVLQYRVYPNLDKMLKRGKISSVSLPNNNRFSYSIYTTEYEKLIFIWDNVKDSYLKTQDYKSNKQLDIFKQYANLIENNVLPGPIAGVLKIEKAQFPSNNAYEVVSIAVIQEYRGNRIGLSLYGIVLSLLGITLISGDTQTPSGAKMWNYIYNVPGVQVRGFFRIKESNLNDKLIDIIMGKLGAEYIGIHNTMHYFAFDVIPRSTKKELTAYIKTKIKVYSDLDDADKHPINTLDVGLYAIWGK